MILTVDVGNSNIVMGVYREDRLVAHWRMTTEPKTSDEFGLFIRHMLQANEINAGDIDSTIIASVVPHVMYSLQHAIRKYLNHMPAIVASTMEAGIRVKYDSVPSLGVDRFVNAVAAHELYGGPVIIVDLGTATKFCALSAQGEYLGGLICPGIKIAMEALVRSTARLPSVELQKPPSVVCTNTVAAMQSGMINGYVGLVNHVIHLMKAELGFEDAKVVATGGLARLIAGETAAIHEINDFLTLEGLRIIAQKYVR